MHKTLQLMERPGLVQLQQPRNYHLFTGQLAAFK